jgi:hypothetical protein
MAATTEPAMPAPAALAAFRHLAPGLGSGPAAPPGWCTVAERPMLVLVGVTGVGKSTAIAALATLGVSFASLPDRRWLTDELIIPAVQLAAGESPHPVADRRLRFELTRRYREQHPGGMAHALAALQVDPRVHRQVLLFDGLRGADEISHGVALLPQAHFAVLHAPDYVRVQRLLNRRDAFDQTAAAGSSGDTALASSLADLGVAGVDELLQPHEAAELLAAVQRGAVDAADLRAKLAIVVEERRNYDPQAAMDALLRLAPDRALIVDTTQATPQEAARRLADRIQALSSNGR